MNLSKPRIKRILRYATWITLGVALITALIVWRLATQRPEWWATSLQESSPESQEEVGAAVEELITTELTQSRKPTDTWQLQLTEQDASAWLTARLPQWLENRSAVVPAEWLRTGVVFRDGEAEIAAEVRLKSGGHRYVGLALEPRITASGDLRITAVAASLGRLRTPFSVIADRLRPRLARLSEASNSHDDAGMNAVDEFIDTHGMTISPAVFQLEDGRRIRIVSIEVHQSRLTLTCQTMPPNERSKKAPRKPQGPAN